VVQDHLVLVVQDHLVLVQQRLQQDHLVLVVQDHLVLVVQDHLVLVVQVNRVLQLWHQKANLQELYSHVQFHQRVRTENVSIITPNVSVTQVTKEQNAMK
jgi:hypothetical protein